MNDQDRLELEQLKRRQELLQQQLALLKGHIEQFDKRLTTEAEKPSAAPVPPVPRPSMPLADVPIKIRAEQPPPIPPIIPPAPVREQAPLHIAREQTPEPVARIAQEIPIPPPPIAAAQTPHVSAREFTAPPPVSPPQASPIAPVEEKGSFELRLGTFWLVRIGIVVLLTGLAFLGYYAYDNIIGRLGPAGKLTLIYLAGGALIGAGAWLQRKGEKPALKNYGQVLFAGGLATVYFATYAAHYLPPLRVITSPFVDGVLLLAWAAVIVFIADRRQSEVLALFAICLAYYTAIVTDIGLFTLYSNLILTAAAIFFLLRNRWATISIISLPATYAAFVFWRFYHHGEFMWDLRSHQLTYGNMFLGMYWVMFTAAIFLSRSEKLIGGARATYVTANNAAFFSMVLLSMWHVNAGGFWKFSLGFGLILMALAATARTWLANEQVVAKTYMTQGLLLVTVGLIAKFSGLQLSLILAAESVALLVISYWQSSIIMRIGAVITAVLSVPFLVVGMQENPTAALGIGVGALLGFNMIWASRREAIIENDVRVLTTFFALLALFSWGYLDWKFVAHEWFGTSLAIAAVLVTAVFYVLNIPEAVLLAQTYLIGSIVMWISRAANGVKVAWWHPLIVITATVGVSHWWKWQKKINMQSAARQSLQGIYALATIGVLYTWLQPNFQPGSWLMFTSLLALGLTIYALATRAWLLAASAQLFFIVSGYEFARQLLNGKPDWYMALVPMIALVSLVWIASEFFLQRLPDEAKENMPQISVVYIAIAVLMSLWWVHEYIPALERVWVLGLVGTLIFLATAWKNSRYVAVFGGVYLAAALGTLFLHQLEPSPAIYFPDFMFIIALLSLQQVARRIPNRFPIMPEWSTAMIIAAMLALWLFVSKWVIQLSSGTVYLTAAWAGLALITIALGFILRERMYRWMGLAILACALGRVVIDVWKLEIIYRILSLLALGVVLLALGFVYNKYQEKIREWL